MRKYSGLGWDEHNNGYRKRIDNIQTTPNIFVGSESPTKVRQGKGGPLV